MVGRPGIDKYTVYTREWSLYWSALYDSSMIVGRYSRLITFVMVAVPQTLPSPSPIFVAIDLLHLNLYSSRRSNALWEILIAICVDSVTRDSAFQSNDPSLTAVIVTISVLPPIRTRLGDSRPLSWLEYVHGVIVRVLASICSWLVTISVFRGWCRLFAEVCEQWCQRGNAAESDLVHVSILYQVRTRSARLLRRSSRWYPREPIVSSFQSLR